MSNSGSALARVENEHVKPAVVDAEWEGLRMVVSPAEALRRVQELQAFVANVMKIDVDFGTIPGTQKPTLYQPGAQKLCELYGLAWTYEDIERVEDWTNGFFFYRKKCVLTSRRDGRYVGDGIGSCNSREDRYGWRWIASEEVPSGMDKKTLTRERKVRWLFESELPDGSDKTKLRTKRMETRRGKTVKYAVETEMFRIPNPDVCSLVNTIEKMACKRSLIHAVLGATRSAGIFTQDVEDLPPEVFGEPEEGRSWEHDEDSGVIAPTEAQMKRFSDLVIELAAVNSTKKLREFGAHAKTAGDKGEVTAEQYQELLRRYRDKEKQAKEAAEKAKATETKPNDAPPEPKAKPADEATKDEEPPAEWEPGSDG